MNTEKIIIIIGVILIIVFAVFLFKPKDKGKRYTPYFAGINNELKSKGPGRPVIFVDLDNLDKNLAIVKKQLHTSLKSDYCKVNSMSVAYRLYFNQK
jgi:hypothetical protein